MRSRRFYVSTSLVYVGLFIVSAALVAPDLVHPRTTMLGTHLVAYLFGAALGLSLAGPLALAFPPKPERLAGLTSLDRLGGAAALVGFAAVSSLWGLDLVLGTPDNVRALWVSAAGGLPGGLLLGATALYAVSGVRGDVRLDVPIRVLDLHAR